MSADVVGLVESALEEAVAALTDPPSRQYVSHGPPAFDCPQVVAWLAMLRPKLIDQGGFGDLSPTARCAMVWVARIGIGIARCVPTVHDDGSPPTPEELTPANDALMADGTAIAFGLSRKWATGEWPCDLSCNQVTFLSVEPVPPEGGMAGWQMFIDVQLG